VGTTLVSGISAFYAANRTSGQSQQVSAAARTYLEYIRSSWTGFSGGTLSLAAMSTVDSNLSGVTASLAISGKDTDSDSFASITTCSNLHSTACSPNSTKLRWDFTLTLTPTNGSSETYRMELGR
jgi:hypothetical protein